MLYNILNNSQYQIVLEGGENKNNFDTKLTLYLHVWVEPSVHIKHVP